MLLIFVIATASCSEVKNVSDRLNSIYADNNVTIDSLEVEKIYASENEIKKIKNLFLMKSLFDEKDVLLRNKIDEKKDVFTIDRVSQQLDKYQNDFDLNTQERLKLVLELDGLIENLSIKSKNKKEFYFANYLRDNESKYSVIVNPEFDIVYAQDSLLNSL